MTDDQSPEPDKGSNDRGTGDRYDLYS
jgi:hypothetical protein